MNTSEWYARPESLKVPAEWGIDAAAAESMAEATWEQILVGENDPDMYLEFFADELDEAKVSDEDAEAFFASVVAARRTQQTQLGGAPESKLTNAFTELETIGVLGRQNFSCCGTCGSAEIWDERDDSRAWRGYLYFHQQDAERIPEDRETYVGYGAFLDQFLPEDEWDGSLGTRILLTDIDFYAEV